MQATEYLGIVDDFYDPLFHDPSAAFHGFAVQSVAKSVYGGPIALSDVDSWVSTDSVIDGARALESRPVKVINFSLGNGKSFESHSSLFQKNAFLTETKQMFQMGITSVVAAGNTFSVFDPSPTSSILASSPFSIAVSALEGASTTAVASYSNLHPGITAFVCSGTWVYQGEALTGTSFSAPYVAGVIAQLQSQFEGALTQAEIRTILEQTSDPIHLTQLNSAATMPGDPGVLHDDVYERINADKALSYPASLVGTVTRQMRVDAAYELIVDANPDAAALAYWTEVCQAHGLQAVVDGLMQSSAHADRVHQLALSTPDAPSYERVTVAEKMQAMYHLFLDREADDAGLAYWMDTVAQSNESRVFGTGDYVNHVFGWSHIEHDFLMGARQAGEDINSFGLL